MNLGGLVDFVRSHLYFELIAWGVLENILVPAEVVVLAGCETVNTEASYEDSAVWSPGNGVP